MADITFSEGVSLIANVYRIAEDHKSEGSNFVGNLSTHRQNAKGDGSTQAVGQGRSLRDIYAGFFGSVSQMATPHFMDLAQDVLNSQQRTPQALMDSVDGDLFQYMIDNSESVQTRDIDFGSIVPANSLGSEVLSQTDFSSTGNWSTSGDFSVGSGDATYSHSSGSGTLTQASGDFAGSLESSQWYKFEYDISSVSGDADANIDTQIAEETVDLGIQSKGATTGAVVYFKTNDSPGDFQIDGSSTSGGFTLDNFSLKKVEITGTGNVLRLNTDRNGQDIEATSMTTKEIECVGDQQTGRNVHEERFRIEFKESYFDSLDWLHPGGSQGMSVVGPENSLVSNGSFEDADISSGSGASIDINSVPDWQINSGGTGNLQLDENNFFAKSQTELDNDQAYALKFTDNEKIFQKIRDIGTTIRPGRPYFLRVQFNRSVGGADGTLTIRMGATTKSVSLSSQSGWKSLTLDMDKGLWYSNFAEEDMDIEIELSGRTTGSLLVDFVSFGEMVQFDGQYYAPVPGETQFRRQDKFEYSDALKGSDGIYQYWNYRFYGRHLPHSGSPSISEP